MSDSATFHDERPPRRRSLAAGLAVLCLVAAWGDAEAQRAMSQYLRDEWTADRGFPGGAVHALTQTGDGYLWIGAEKGLVRFDGLAFRLLEPTGASGHAGPTVLGVVAAPDGSLWARLRGVGLLRHHDDAFENILPALGAPESVVSAMARGRGSSILAATLARGAQIYRDGRFQTVASPQALPGAAFVIAMAQTENGDVWLGTRGGGLLRVQSTRVTRFTDGLPDLKVDSLLAGDGNELWIGTSKGVVRWTGTALTAAGVPAALTGLQALAMIRDRAANVWIAAGSGGLVRVDGTGRASRWEPDDGPGRNVTSVFEDRDGNVWAGTDRGIERWRDAAFVTYSTAQGLPPAAIGPVFVDGRGRVWFAPTSGGLSWLEDGVVGRVTDAGLDRDVIYSIDGAGDEVWVGRQRGGVTRLRHSAAGWSAAPLAQPDRLPQSGVYAVALGRGGALWAGTLSAGASRILDGAVTTFTAADGLASNTIAAIVEDSDGTVWFATPGGLSAYRQGWRTYTTRDGLPSDDVNTVFEDRHAVLWVGTTNGLALVQKGQLRPCAGVPASLRASILGLADDRSGSLWVNTTSRVLRVDREALLRGEVTPAHVREYGVPDGLPAIEAMKRHRTLVGDSGGRIWLALHRGLSVIDPGRTADPPPALAHVESISADGAPLSVRGAIAIPSARRRIAFTFTGLSLSVPERVRYRYRLDGFDGEWSETTADRQAVYTNLSPGPYRFRVAASSSEGRWDGQEASLPFVVQPTLWQTRWFQAMAVIGGFAVAGGLYRLHVRQVARQLNVRFEERLAERTRIARELHDTLLQGFLSASMQIHVVADRLPEDSPVAPALRRALDLMRRVIEEGRNAVRGLRSSAVDPHELGHAFSAIQSELAAGETPRYQVVVEGTPRPLNPAIRDDVYRIGREALMNAFRHSGAAAIEIEIEYAPGELRLFVRDDGCGIDPDVVRAGVRGHWGIAGMKERAGQIGGSLTIRSRAAAGTEIELRVPERAAFTHDPSVHDRRSWVRRLFASRARAAAARPGGPPEPHS